MSSISLLTRGFIPEDNNAHGPAIATNGFIDFFSIFYIPTFLIPPSYTISPGFFNPIEPDRHQILAAVDSPIRVNVKGQVLANIDSPMAAIVNSRELLAITDVPMLENVGEIELINVKKPRKP